MAALVAFLGTGHFRRMLLDYLVGINIKKLKFRVVSRSMSPGRNSVFVNFLKLLIQMSATTTDRRFIVHS